MKRSLIALLLMIITLGCTISFKNDDNAFEEKAGTQVAVALTATALDQYFSSDTQDKQSETTQATPNPTPSKETESEAKESLGSPTYVDNCSTLNAWSADPVDEIIVEDITTININNGRLALQSSQVGKFHWRLNYQEFSDGYLEAKFETGNCSGNDQYGLIFRAPDYSDGVGYYFTMTCDGQFGLREKIEPYSFMQESEMIIPLKSNDNINSGSDQTNILGVKTMDDSLKLFINDQQIDEISNLNLTDDGHFGVYIYARQTQGFAIYLDEISYWD